MYADCVATCNNDDDVINDVLSHSHDKTLSAEVAVICPDWEIADKKECLKAENFNKTLFKVLRRKKC